MTARTASRLRVARRLIVVLIGLSTAGLHVASARAGDCDSTNGSQDPDCTVQYTHVRIPSLPYLGWDQVEAGPINANGSASCTKSRGCGYPGVAPIAVGGDAHCTATERGCGDFGTAPIAIGGNVSCSGSCGSDGTGPIAIGGNADCDGACGNVANGPIATGDVSCSGRCGRSTFICVLVCTPNLPRSGTPGISINGHAYCSRPFDRSQATDPDTALDHLENFECMSVRDATGLSVRAEHLAAT